MNYNQLHRKITNGEIAADHRFWVVDVRYENVDNKPVRNVLPIEVMLAQNNVNDPRYYRHEFTFRPFKPNGELSAKSIAIYPSVYRSRPEDSLHIFLTKEEAEAKFQEQCFEILRQVEDRKVRTIARFDEIIMDITRKLDSIS